MSLLETMQIACGQDFGLICDLVRKDGRVFTNTPSSFTTLNCMFSFPEDMFDTCWGYTKEIGTFTNTELVDVIRAPNSIVRTRKLPSIFKFPESA